MSADYDAVQKALAAGADPAMLCTTCPWDRYCISPPMMTKAQVDAEIDKASSQDKLAADAARAAGREVPMPGATLLTALTFAGKDTMGHLCPVFALRLRSSKGRELADATKAAMRDWDDQS